MYKHRYIALIARKVRSLCYFDDFLNKMRSSCDAYSSRRCFIQALKASFSCYLKLVLPPFKSLDKKKVSPEKYSNLFIK